MVGKQLHDQAIEGLKAIRKRNLPATIDFVMTNRNFGEIDGVLAVVSGRPLDR